MSKQLLIYNEARPISTELHRNWSVKAGQNFSFAREINSVPLTTVEFIPASEDFPIVFSGGENEPVPVVIMGVRPSENLFVDKNGKMTASYVPAFLRRYPFVFSSSDDGANFTLCIDEEFEGCNQDNRGERLFDSDGEQTQYLNTVLEFLKEYQVQFARTQALTAKLVELDLLEPMGAQIRPAGGANITLTGFKAVSRQKLKMLPGEELEKLARSDALELIYVHLHSMRNFNHMLPQLQDTPGETDAAKSNGKGMTRGKTRAKPAAKAATKSENKTAAKSD